MRSCQLPAALPEPEPPGALDAERCPKLWKQRVESLGWDQPGGRVRTGGAAGCGDVVWDPSHALGGLGHSVFPRPGPGPAGAPSGGRPAGFGRVKAAGRPSPSPSPGRGAPAPGRAGAGPDVPGGASRGPRSHTPQGSRGAQSPKERGPDLRDGEVAPHAAAAAAGRAGPAGRGAGGRRPQPAPTLLQSGRGSPHRRLGHLRRGGPGARLPAPHRGSLLQAGGGPRGRRGPQPDHPGERRPGRVAAGGVRAGSNLQRLADLAASAPGQGEPRHERKPPRPAPTLRFHISENRRDSNSAIQVVPENGVCPSPPAPLEGGT